MKLQHLDLTDEPMHWDDSLPQYFKGVRLPGSRLLSAVGDFGSVCIQEFYTDLFSIRYNVFDLLQKLVCRATYTGSAMHSKIVLKGKIQQQVNANSKWPVNQNQFTIIDNDSKEIAETYEKDLHISFDTTLSFRLTDEIIKLFPSYGKDFNPAGITTPAWADAETLDLVHSILDCKYEKELRQHFFQNRVKDLLFKYMVLLSGDRSSVKEASENELNAIYSAEKIITGNIAAHNPIPDLAKKVLLNEFRFKQLFKIVFGSGPYEYLIRKRLEKGRTLLESGLSVKETAAQVGYRPSDFTTAFRNHFGFPPGVLKKRN